VLIAVVFAITVCQAEMCEIRCVPSGTGSAEHHAAQVNGGHHHAGHNSAQLNHLSGVGHHHDCSAAAMVNRPAVTSAASTQQALPAAALIASVMIDACPDAVPTASPPHLSPALSSNSTILRI